MQALIVGVGKTNIPSQVYQNVMYCVCKLVSNLLLNIVDILYDTYGMAFDPFAGIC